METFGEIVRRRRQELGYTAVVLAKQLGITTQAVSNWETKPGRSAARKSLTRLAEVLELPVEDLLAGTSSKYNVIASARPANPERLNQASAINRTGHATG